MDSEFDVKRCYDVVIKLVDEAGNIIASRNDQQKTISEKSCDVDLLTETDQEVETLLISNLSKEFPTHRFIGEEETSEGKKVELTDLPTWIIDPVDGTMNFVHTFPHSCISVALLVNKDPQIGIIYNPILNQKFTAIKGEGAFLNGRRIKVSGQTDLGKALITTEFGTTRDTEKLDVTMDNLRKTIESAHGIRALGSAALNMAMVALGAADCNYEFGIHAWDIAAGDLIVREAGGVTSDPTGQPLDFMARRVLAASSPELANKVANLLTQYYPPRD
ncbi:Inositol monophosphatase 2 [Pseudolycoriella hygida]|uniref:Inositol-1-monophosphatase n=1 Tax=Pseudolycoriella hygida TaxID=35572 RepID=A0A9Q0S2E5_9DIPT|nr:Inositol monophosphatase 2 [Pseudolycoriella hygida]